MECVFCMLEPNEEKYQLPIELLSGFIQLKEGNNNNNKKTRTTRGITVYSWKCWPEGSNFYDQPYYVCLSNAEPKWIDVLNAFAFSSYQTVADDF